MKKTLIAIPVLLVLAYIVALPYITVYQIRDAVKNHDSSALSDHIDYPSVRQSLKDQLNAMLMGKMQGDDMKDNPFAALGMAFAGPIVDKMVDAYVTPAGVAQLMAGEKPSLKKKNPTVMPTDGATIDAASEPEKEKPLDDVALGYKSSNRFEVEDKKKGLRVVLRRQGLDWKVAEIILPEEE
ncbi:MAG: DUF2939 domain-containing protein [Pseudomonadales bacterium]